MKTEQVYDRTIELVQKLHRERPDVPILFVEAFPYTNGFLLIPESVNSKRNNEMKRAYETLKRVGIKNIYYRKGADLIGYDYEGTVDGVHPNDIGMLRIAEALEPVIKKLAK